jgi:ankyrin repeat protein
MVWSITMVFNKYITALIMIFLASAAGYPAGEPINDTASSKTSLNLRLWGTITGNNISAFAIIEDTTTGEHKLYKAGDAIQNATVVMILRQKVVLRIDDRLELLAIESSRPGADAGDNDGSAALIEASFEGDKQAVELLIQEGANLDARDRLGDTALMSAALKGHIEIVELLLSKGADVSLADNWGNTALIDSAKYARDSTCDIIALLVGNAADVNAKNKLGLTALIFAAQGGHVENIGCLIAAGADVNAKSKSGETALKLAETSERKDIIDLLKDNGARE